MPERSSLNQNIQIGVEATPGTPVAALKRLTALGIEPSPQVEATQFRPIGSKFNALSTLGKEWVESALTGKLTYTEIVYALSSVVTTGTITTPVSGATKWDFTPNDRSDDSPKTFTVEHGSAVRADRFSYGIITELGMTFNRSAVDLTGAMLGRALTDSITMTPAATAVPLVPVLPTQVSVYIDPTAAGLGTTKMLRMLSAEFTLGTRYGPVWVLDAAQPSFVNHVETAPDLTMTMTLEADSQGMALLQSMRDGVQKFVRVEAIGGNIPGAPTQPYKFDLDMSLAISNTGGFSDAEGVYAIQFSGIGITDPTWNKTLDISVINDVATL
jgi:hypothetical protein